MTWSMPSRFKQRTGPMSDVFAVGGASFGVPKRWFTGNPCKNAQGFREKKKVHKNLPIPTSKAQLETMLTSMKSCVIYQVSSISKYTTVYISILYILKYYIFPFTNLTPTHFCLTKTPVATNAPNSQGSSSENWLSCGSSTSCTTSALACSAGTGTTTGGTSAELLSCKAGSYDLFHISTYAGWFIRFIWRWFSFSPWWDMLVPRKILESIIPHQSGWWLNQANWKKCSTMLVNMGIISPNVGVKIKSLWNQ